MLRKTSEVPASIVLARERKNWYFQPSPSPTCDPGELGVARDLDHGPDLYAGALHVDQEIGQAFPRVGFLAFADEEHAPLRDMGKRRPDLLSVDDVVVALVLCPGLQP